MRMKNLLLISIVFLWVSGCSKSTSDTPASLNASPASSCTTNICRLTDHIWKISSQTIYTDIGQYSYNTSQITGIDWSTFSFKTDSSYIDFAGGKGGYIYSDSMKTLILVDNYLPIHFAVTALTESSLTLTGQKTNMNPRTDMSEEANFSIQNLGASLHNDFGVDTSKIHYIQAVFNYSY